ncbi:phosphate ABC transporter periplasmic phosphate-binding protein PstS [Desulfocucumis palustris]|uniref:Phosphate-binding protein n=1 Tax=Desulfocucumis palustris TaxID=1898651 RepID=A0A2L2X9C6_9FIRM|nr:phosphate ABC transporter substrate-binding protein [Desulfocucumis palustris]GBF32632.1 phosphate ABC transporter periplasmic phosphate-binding protein PstS [Desulfocucumis palustris]
MKRLTKLTAIFMLVAFSLTMFATMAPAATLSGTITMSGSTTVQPVAELLKAQFTKANPGVQITIAGGGSGVGIVDVSEGKVNIGNASRALKTGDPAGLVANTIGYDAICVIVNPKNTVKALTKEQVNQIFTGKITNWSAVGGKNAPIFVNIRTSPSGTMDFFNESFMGEPSTQVQGTATMVATAKQHESNALMVAAVAKDVNAIGFCSMGYVKTTVKAVALDGVAATVQNSIAGTYKYVRPLNMVTNGPAIGLSKSFIDYALSAAGQKIVSTEWIAVSQKPKK